MSREGMRMTFVAVLTTVIGAFFGQAAVNHASGVAVGGLSGALTGCVYELLMRRLHAGRLLTALAGAGLGGVSGTLSGALAHLPSHLMGLHAMFAGLGVGAVFGLFVGVVVGAALSFRYP